MDMRTVPPPRGEPGPLTKLLHKIAGIDEHTMRACPPSDWDNASMIGAIMILSWIYQTALFAVVGHQLFAARGQIRPDVLMASMFLATFILFIDSYMVMRAGWYSSGLSELKRAGGLDISGGPAARIKSGVFLSIRILLSVGLAQLTAIFVGLLIFSADVNAPIEKDYLQANGHLIEEATKLVDGGIRRATDAVTAQSVHVAEVSAQLRAVRQNEIADPVHQAEQELTQLIARKAKADDDVRNAETFATNEAGGIRGAAGNSGRPGYGARYRAAAEQATNAKARAQAAATDLNAARARLDTLRKDIPSGTDAVKQRVHDQRSDFEKTLDGEAARLMGLKAELANLTRSRESNIRRAVEDSPDFVGRRNGLLAQIRVLKDIAREDIWTALLIGLIDFVSFGFELAAVLAKVTTHVPTKYAALVARDAYLQPVRIADEMMAELKGIDRQRDEQADVPPRESLPDGKPGSGATSAPDLFGSLNGSASPPPKRGRGRPRKHPPSV